MSFAPITPSAARSPSGLGIGYASPPLPNPDRIVCAPWTQRDINDMQNIQFSLGWLIDEIKSGYALTEERHGFTLRSVISASHALAEKQRAWRQKYDPHQPRVPAGQSGGGQWTDARGTDAGGTDSGGVTLPRRKPMSAIAKPHPHADSPYYNPATGIYDPPLKPTWSPLDFIGLPAKPAAGAVGGSAQAAYNAVRAAAVRREGIQQGREFLRRQAQEKLTDHGTLRIGQRLRSEQEVNVAVESAIKTGKITDKIGKYGTRQFHYQGNNGLTVIIETEGKNAGKVVTAFGNGPGGKL
ncbi:MAG: hypothetical protein ACK4PK_04050 [Alphaproteobacteria bacterium]